MEYSIFNAECEIKGNLELMVTLLDIFKCFDLPLELVNGGAFIATTTLSEIDSILPPTVAEYIGWRSSRLSSGAYAPIRKIESNYLEIREFIKKAQLTHLPCIVAIL